jgi:hypothetical protein
MYSLTNITDISLLTKKDINALSISINEAKKSKFTSSLKLGCSILCSWHSLHWL